MVAAEILRRSSDVFEARSPKDWTYPGEPEGENDFEAF
jgi:hypothetical protein